MTGAGKVTSHPGAQRSLNQTQSPESAVVLDAAAAAGQTTEGVGGITASEVGFVGTAATEGVGGIAASSEGVGFVGAAASAGVGGIVVVAAASTIVAELLGMPG